MELGLDERGFGLKIGLALFAVDRLRNRGPTLGVRRAGETENEVVEGADPEFEQGCVQLIKVKCRQTSRYELCSVTSNAM